MKCDTVNIKNGSSGNDVKELQKFLSYYEFYGGNVDGVCGSLTVEAIKNFQRSKSLKVDGIFGSITCKSSNINGSDISNSSKVLKLSVFEDMMVRFENFVQLNNREPKILYIDKNYPYEYISNTKYNEMKQRYDNFIKTNKRKPNTMSVNKANNTNTTNNTNNNTSTYTISYLCEKSGGNCLGQITSYHCGPHSIKQCLRKFGITKYSESTIGGYAGTTSKGTGHAGLETAIAKIAKLEGITLKVEWKNFSDLGNTISERFKKYGELITSPDKACFWHEYYRNAYGHYSLPKKVELKNSNLIIANSLGSKCSSPAYCGYMENRTFSTQKSYFGGISQKSICIITKL